MHVLYLNNMGIYMNIATVSVKSDKNGILCYTGLIQALLTSILLRYIL
jgi:hypothetical protein